MPRLTAEQLNAAHETFEFKEREVEFEELGGDILVRELAAGQRSKLLKGLLDANGNISDLMEFQVRMAAKAIIEPSMSEKEVRKFLPKWPASKVDMIIDVAGKLGGDKEAAAAEQEFRDED